MINTTMSDEHYAPRASRRSANFCYLAVLCAALSFEGCIPSNDTIVDPLDQTALPQLHLTELEEFGREIDGSTPVLSRVTDAISLGNEGIALASDEGEILVFGVDGGFRRRLGRRGEGPGEFQFIQDIVRLDDNRILAWDPALDRVTVFEPDGRLDFTCTPHWAKSKQAGVGFVGAFGDGTFVLEDMTHRVLLESAAEGFRSDTIPYLLFDQSGELAGTLEKFVRRQRYYDATTGYQSYLFESSVLSTIVGDKLWVGENDMIVIQRSDSTGAQHSPLTLDRDPRRVTELDIEAGWRAWAEQMVAQQEQMVVQLSASFGAGAAAAMQQRAEEDMARARAAIEPAEFLPAYKSIIVGGDRALWLEDYLHPTETITRWFLMDDDFQPVGWIEFQSNELLLAAGPNRLIVLRKDDLDVESVIVYGGDWTSASSFSGT